MRKSRAPVSKQDKCAHCGKLKNEIISWRRGPDGFRSLCNSCGLKFLNVVKKEKKLDEEYEPKKDIMNLSTILNTDDEEEKTTLN